MPNRISLSPDNGLPFSCADCVLRRLRKTDQSQFQAYRSDPVVGQYQGWEPMDDVVAAEFLQRMEHSEMFVHGVWQQLGIALSGEGLLVGDIGICLSETGEQAELGITLDPGWQQRGIATAAFSGAMALIFEHTSADRVVAITDARNDASIRLLERVGMKKVCEHQSRFRGEACVEYEYALSRDDLVWKTERRPSR